MLAGKKFSTNEEVITETEAYFEAMSKSYYKNDFAQFDAHNSSRIIYSAQFIVKKIR
jgi:hypothetical protein